METVNLRYRPTGESLRNINPRQTIYENDDYVVYINGNSVGVVFKAYRLSEPCGSTDTEVSINQMRIRQLYNNQGNKITLKDILNNIKEQYDDFNSHRVNTLLRY